MKLKNNLVLIDSTISYNEIKHLRDNSDFITFDNDSHLMLQNHNLSHSVSDSLINNAEFDLIQEKLYIFANWYDDEKIKNNLIYKSVNLGSLFYIEFWMFLIPIVKKFFEIIKLSKKIDGQNVYGSQIICQMAQCLQLNFFNINDNKKGVEYFYDNLEFNTNFFSLKLSSKNFNKLKNMSEKIFQPLVEQKNISKKNSVALIEFNTLSIENLLQEFKTKNITTISYCRRRPAVWNLKSLEIVRKNDCIIPTHPNLINDKIVKNFPNIFQEKLLSLSNLFENEVIFSKFFEINEISFWKFLKPYLHTLFKKRLENLLFEIDLGYEMLNQTKPDYALIQSESGNTEQIILSISKTLNIPVILLQHGFLKSTEGGFKLNKFTKSIMNDSDQFIVWGNFTLENLQKFGMDKTKTFSLGSYTHDKLFSSQKIPKNKPSHSLLLPEGPIMGDIRDYTIDELEKYKNSLIHIFKTTKNLNKKLIVKLHPYESDHNEQEIAKMIDQSISVVKKKNLTSLLQNSDVVISLGTSISTAVIDAIILNKPVIRLKFGEWYGDYGDGSCLNVEKEEFQDKLNQIITDDKFRKQLLLTQKEFLDNYIINQGNATRNIVTHISNMLG